MFFLFCHRFLKFSSACRFTLIYKIIRLQDCNIIPTMCYLSSSNGWMPQYYVNKIKQNNNLQHSWIYLLTLFTLWVGIQGSQFNTLEGSWFHFATLKGVSGLRFLNPRLWVPGFWPQLHTMSIAECQVEYNKYSPSFLYYAINLLLESESSKNYFLRRTSPTWD